MRSKRVTSGQEDQEEQEKGPARGENRKAGGDDEISLMLQSSGRCRPPRSTSGRGAEADEEQRGGEGQHRRQHEGADVRLRVGEGEWSHLAHGGPWRPAGSGATDLGSLTTNAHRRPLGRPAGRAHGPLLRKVRRYRRSTRRSDDHRGRSLRRRSLGRWLGRYTRLRGRLGAWPYLRHWFWVRPERCSRGRPAREETRERQCEEKSSRKSAGQPQVHHRPHVLTCTERLQTRFEGIASILEDSSSR